MRPIDGRRFEGLPLPVGMPVTRIGDLGWNAVRDLEYPVLVLREEQLVHNITTMADYCRRHRVELAPHAKTSLSPQLIRHQMESRAEQDLVENYAVATSQIAQPHCARCWADSRH